jgi:dienelactone hydrolase
VGYWGELLPHALIVEGIAADGMAHVVYAVGDAPTWGIARAWFRAAGTLDGRRLVLDGPRARITYELDRSGHRLLGAYLAANGQLTVGVFERARPGYLADPANVLPCPHLGETVRIPHRSATLPDGSRPLTLEGTLYRSDSNGAGRLAVISHGSSDGICPRQTLRHEAQARWLLELGFVVLVPMRRGRGASEGVCGETSCCGHDRAALECRLGLEEAVADLASAVAHGRALPKGDGSRPVLLVGQSRGGLLSAVYAGRYLDEVAGVINFAGGWTADWCNGAVNADALVEAAPTARAPQLWLYGEKDSYYGEGHIRANHAAFLRAGGRADLEVPGCPRQRPWPDLVPGAVAQARRRVHPAAGLVRA